MTITTTTLRAQYNGNGVTTSFAVPFEFLEGSTLKVILTSAAGVDTTQTITTHYTVTGGGTVQPDDGSVVMVTAPATGETLTILRAQPLTQAASYTEQGPFPAKAHEKALDRIDMQVQMISERVNRAMKLKETSANSDLIFPEPSADEVVGWNAAGTALENKTISDLGNLVEDSDDITQGVTNLFMTTAERAKVGNITVTQAVDLDAMETTLAGAVLEGDTSTAAMQFVIDEDSMASNSATKIPTQQSVKAYADAKFVATRTALKDLDTTVHTTAFLSESGREGLFFWRTGNYSTQIAADTQEGLYVKANAIASTAGSWVRQRDDLTCNVKWFGATGDGSTVDTTAVQAAIDMVTTQGKVYFPAGTYSLGALSKTLATGQSIAIVGDSPGSTVLYYAANAVGLSITCPTTAFAWISGNEILIEDLSFVTNVQNTGYAVQIDGNCTIGNPMRPTVFNRVGFRGTINNSSYWLVGAHITDVQNAIFTDCFYFSYTTGLLGTGIFYTGTSNTEHPTVLNVHNFNQQFGEYGVRVNGYIEGVNVLQSNFTQVANGISFASTPGNLPQCSICDSQIWASNVAIATNATASQITGNLIFVSGTSYAILGTPVYTTISGNTFVGQSGSPNGIVLQSGATDNIIEGNVFKGIVTNIWIQSGANNNTIGLNQHADGTAMLDQGSGNTSGLVPTIQTVTVQGSDVSLTNNITTAQNLFAAANDTLTVKGATAYIFRARLMIATGTTTHTTAFGFGGTATFTNIHYRSLLWSGTSGTISTTAPSKLDVSAATATVLNATSGAAFTEIEIEGVMRINAGGTLIPQITFSAGPTGTCAVKVNSWLELWPIGSNTVAAIGPWA
jgi:hypothetical protein